MGGGRAGCWVGTQAETDGLRTRAEAAEHALQDRGEDLRLARARLADALAAADDAARAARARELVWQAEELRLRHSLQAHGTPAGEERGPGPCSPARAWTPWRLGSLEQQLDEKILRGGSSSSGGGGGGGGGGGPGAGPGKAGDGPSYNKAVVDEIQNRYAAGCPPGAPNPPLRPGISHCRSDSICQRLGVAGPPRLGPVGRGILECLACQGFMLA
jgi:hypothetical protein